VNKQFGQAKKNGSPRTDAEPFFAQQTAKPSPFFNPTARASRPMIQSAFFQTKLSIGEADDIYEQEADQVADTVVGNTASSNDGAETQQASSVVQRKCNDCDENKVQRKEGVGTESESTRISMENLTNLGAGQALSSGERRYFEPRFGTSFADVRLHTNHNAAQKAEAINARAYTSGNHIVFNRGQYNPASHSGKYLMAHELTHTIQQGSRNSSTIIVPKLQRDEFEPWPGQLGNDVAGTRETTGDIVREQVERTGDPTYAQLDPMLLEFNRATCALTVRKEINFVRAGSGASQLSETDFNELKERILRIANEQLNGWVSLHVDQTDGCPIQCVNGDISVTVVASEGSGTHSTTLNLHRSFGREDAGNIGADASTRTIWHEMGHIVLGAADEYAEANRPDGTPRPASRVHTSDWSIMSAEGNARRAMMHARHFSHLGAWLGRRFPDCTFSINETSRPIVVEFSPVLMLGGFGAAGHGGLYYSAGMNIGIPLTRLRQLQFILGPRINFIYDAGEANMLQLLMGFRAGLEGQFGSTGFRLGGFGEGGGVGFTDLGRGTFGASPYVEGGLGFGYSLMGGSFNLGLEVAGGGREFALPAPTTGTEFSPYFRLGLGFGGSF
jgi:hypothetical protein